MLTRERRDGLLAIAKGVSNQHGNKPTDQTRQIRRLADVLAEILRSLPISEETSE